MRIGIVTERTLVSTEAGAGFFSSLTSSIILALVINMGIIKACLESETDRKTKRGNV
jgi:hypothetical protein